jgi:hypothetical protein
MTVRRGRWRRRLIVLIAIPLVMLACVGITTFALDNLCYTALTQRLPIYPGATVTVERHNGLRAFGMGETIMVIETDDPLDTVRDWYGVNAGGAVRRMQQQGQMVLVNITETSYSATTAEDGTGTQVLLSGVCGG